MRKCGNLFLAILMMCGLLLTGCSKEKDSFKLSDFDKDDQFLYAFEWGSTRDEIEKELGRSLKQHEIIPTLFLDNEPARFLEKEGTPNYRFTNEGGLESVGFVFHDEEKYLNDFYKELLSEAEKLYGKPDEVYGDPNISGSTGVKWEKKDKEGNVTTFAIQTDSLLENIFYVEFGVMDS